MSNINVLVYYNGIKFVGQEGIIFEGDKRLIRVNREIGYDMLKQKFFIKLKLQRNQYISTITFRFPTSTNKYTTLEIVDDDEIVDDEVECMLSTLEQQLTSIVLELYVDIGIVGSSSNAPCADEPGDGDGNDDDEDLVIMHSSMESIDEEDEDNIGDCNSTDSDSDSEGDGTSLLQSPVVVVSPISSTLHGQHPTHLPGKHN